MMQATMMVFLDPSGRWWVIMVVVLRGSSRLGTYFEFLYDKPEEENAGEEFKMLQNPRGIEQRASIELLI